MIERPWGGRALGPTSGPVRIQYPASIIDGEFKMCLPSAVELPEASADRLTFGLLTSGPKESAL